MNKWGYILILFSLGIVSCNNGGKDKKEELSTLAYTEDIPRVKTLNLASQDFAHTIISNGKIEAGKEADLFFGEQGYVKNIFFKNGQKVRKGEKIAELDSLKLLIRVERAEYNLEKAKLEYQDVLIGQGYSISQTKNVPDDIARLAKLRSGYRGAEIELSDAKLALREAILSSPFDGVISNLKTKLFEKAGPSHPFCRVIAANNMMVRFNILESEFPLVNVGDKVEVKPFTPGASEYKGEIAEINPLISKEGMVEVVAKINQQKGLVAGMNARVVVKRIVKNCLVVPKQAVIERSGNLVLFTVDKNIAKWHYIEIPYENLEEYVVTGKDVKEGQEVIISNNDNLSHGSKVVVY